MDYDKDQYQTQTNFRGSILNVLRISLMDGPFLCLSLCYTYWGWVRSGIRQASPIPLRSANSSSSPSSCSSSLFGVRDERVLKLPADSEDRLTASI